MATIYDIDTNKLIIKAAEELKKIPEIAKKHNLVGFRTILNTGREGGQIIDHIHFHLLGGSKLPRF